MMDRNDIFQTIRNDRMKSEMIIEDINRFRILESDTDYRTSNMDRKRGWARSVTNQSMRNMNKQHPHTSASELPTKCSVSDCTFHFRKKSFNFITLTVLLYLEL